MNLESFISIDWTIPMIYKTNNKLISAFTIIEMLIVLIIMGILLMLVIGLSWDQIQKIQDKTVKESIVSEWQSRYSRNLWSSSFAWIMYDNMEIGLVRDENCINFTYNTTSNTWIENTFSDKFVIKYVGWNDDIKLKYHPYNISCEIWDEEDIEKLDVIVRINDRKDYCFEINQKNCRLIEMSESKCELLKKDTWIE